MIKISTIFTFFLYVCQLFSQDTAYAHKVLYDLCNPKMQGRGYINKGCIKASKYIAKQMKDVNLTHFGNSYFQKFDLTSNNLLKVSLTINNITLQTGLQYEALNYSPTTKQAVSFKQKVGLNDSGFLDFENTWIVDSNCKIKEQVLYKLAVAKGIKALIFLKSSKTMQTVSQEVANFAKIEISYSALPKVLANINNWKTIKLNIVAKLQNSTQQNVIGKVNGTYKDSTIIVCAHYDHLGKCGNAMYVGANDNACGAAMVLDLAKKFAQTKPKYTMVFIAFAAEEIGLVGSKYFVDNPLVDLTKVKCVLNLDLVGTGQKGATVVNATIFPKEYNLLVAKNQNLLPTITKRGKAANSDHHFFTEKGIPSLFVYLAGNRPAYHDVNDIPQTLPLNMYGNTFTLFHNFLLAL